MTDDSARTVYRLLGGGKYHKEACSWWRGYPDWKVVQSSPEEAEADGYEPCKVCHHGDE